MIERYQHTQIGYIIIIILTIVILFIALFMMFNGFDWISSAVLFILGICLVLFTTLTVIIDEGFLTVRFGPGFVRKYFPLKDIESCKIVKNPWYYGWGIHLTPHGWLYNVSGFSAIEIRMKTGKKYRIGTDVPNILEKALRESVEKKNGDG